MARQKKPVGGHAYTRNQLVKHVKNEALRPVYLLYGDEPYLIQHMEHMIIDKACPEGLLTDGRVIDLDGKANQIDFSHLLEELQTPSFISPYRLVVLQHSGLFKSSTYHDAFMELLPQIPERSVLLLIEEKADGRYKKVYKALEEAGGIICMLNQQDDAELMAWIATYFKHFSLQITKGACRSLVERCDREMTLILQEMKKLRLYAQGKDMKAIRLETVEKICIPDLQGSIFNLSAEIVAGNVQGALELYDRLLEKREPIPVLLLMIGRLFRQLLVAQESGFNQQELSRNLDERRYFILRKLLNQARAYDPESLRKLILQAAEADAAMKGGSPLDPEVILEMLILMAGDRAV